MKLLSQMTTDISIHALLAESDGCRIEHDAAVAYDFYPRSPCGERLVPVLLSFSYSIISIHALLAESDEFQSVGIAHLFISIHALLAESDFAAQRPVRRHAKFLSTLSLRRATSRTVIMEGIKTIFLSTLSLRRATARARSRL